MIYNFFSGLLFFAEVEKALGKRKKDKTKKAKKKGDTDELPSFKEGDYMNKKDENSKSKGSAFKKFSNSFNPSGPPPEPPARPAMKEQTVNEEPESTHRHSLTESQGGPAMSNVLKELGTRSGTLRKSSDVARGKTPEKEDHPPKFDATSLQKRPPAPLPTDYQHKQEEQKEQQQPQGQLRRPLLPPGHEKGPKLGAATPHQTPNKPLPFHQGQTKPLPATPRQALQKSLSSPPPVPGHNKKVSSPFNEDMKPIEEDRQDVQNSKKPKPTEVAAKPCPARAKSSDNLPTDGGKPRSPIPRPRIRPPPPPPPVKLKDTEKSTSSSSLASIDASVSQVVNDDHTSSPKPRPLPRVRHRGEQHPSSVDQQHGTQEHENGKGVATPRKSERPMSPTGNGPNISRQPSVKSKPVHPPPSVPGVARKPSNSSSSAVQQKTVPSETNLSSPGHRPSPGGPKPKPPAKPNIPRRPKITPPSFKPDPSLSPQVNEILQLSNQGQSKVKEILSLTDARIMDDSQNNLLDTISDLQKISREVLESSSSLTDSLGPQARFGVRRTVTDLESKYSDIEGVMQTVGPNLNAVDMERIGKVVHSFSGALDSICSTVRATSS